MIYVEFVTNTSGNHGNLEEVIEITTLNISRFQGSVFKMIMVWQNLIR